jgi:drug/metabolite transporter (DMT)-like permease
MSQDTIFGLSIQFASFTIQGMSTRLTPVVILAAGVTVLFWGSAFPGIRAGLEAYSPTHLAVLRFLSASLVMLIYALVTRMRLPARKDLPRIFLLGLSGFTFYNVALNIGEVNIAAGPASLLVQTVPIWTILMAMLFLKERLRLWGWLGIVISFCGVLVIAFGNGQSFHLTWGAVLILSAAISSSVYNILQKQMLASYRPVEITTYAIWAGTLLLLPYANGLLGQMQVAPHDATLAVVYLGVFPAALAYTIWAFLLSKMPAGRAASFLYAVPVMAFLIGWVWLGETLKVIDLVGGFFALGGVVLVNTLGREKG